MHDQIRQLQSVLFAFDNLLELFMSW